MRSEQHSTQLAAFSGAIRSRNARQVATLVELLSFGFGMRYKELLLEAQKADPSIDLAEFDTLIVDGEEERADAC